jgi:hypothetical protein
MAAWGAQGCRTSPTASVFVSGVVAQDDAIALGVKGQKTLSKMWCNLRNSSPLMPRRCGQAVSETVG